MFQNGATYTDPTKAFNLSAQNKFEALKIKQ